VKIRVKINQVIKTIPPKRTPPRAQRRAISFGKERIFFLDKIRNPAPIKLMQIAGGLVSGNIKIGIQLERRYTPTRTATSSTSRVLGLNPPFPTWLWFSVFCICVTPEFPLRVREVWPV